MEITFTKGNWERYFNYAYTRRLPHTPRFIQEADCIVNARKSEFTTILLKDRYTPGARISFTASFESYGAPLLVIVKDLERDEQGNLRFWDYQEIVLWEKGVNVWNFQKDETNSGNTRWDGFSAVENGIRIDWLMSNCHPLEAGKLYTMTVELGKQRLKVWVEGHYFELRVPSLPEKAYLGITACEGINRFYNLTLEPGVPER